MAELLIKGNIAVDQAGKGELLTALDVGADFVAEAICPDGIDPAASDDRADDAACGRSGAVVVEPHRNGIGDRLGVASRACF